VDVTVSPHKIRFGSRHCKSLNASISLGRRVEESFKLMVPESQATTWESYGFWIGPGGFSRPGRCSGMPMLR
jgi:hypothetical protein